MGEVRVGTSGWSYPSWVGPFYPERTPASKMLQVYAETFRTVEAHATHRRTPTASALARWQVSLSSVTDWVLAASSNRSS